MPRILYTVDNLVSEVRSQIDEANVDSVDTQNDILTSLNRAQSYAFNILAHKYNEPILDYFFMPLLGNIAEYPIPDAVFEDRIQKIEVQVPATPAGQTPFPPPVDPASGNIGNTFREIQRISYRDVSNYESSSRTNVPYYYAIYGRTMRFVPTPTGTYGVRIWFLRQIETLVLPQGRVTIANTAQNYVVVDQVGDNLTTEADQLGSYCNIVDGASGEIRATVQIQSIAGNKISFRSVPTRTQVVGRTVGGDLTTTGIQQDDYLAPIDGTCVPYFGQPTSNFLIQYAVSEITRKLGGQADSEEAILKKFEDQVSRVWTGRETTLRIKKRSQAFGVPTRRWYYQ